jgi:hypothetical protein
MPRISKTLLVLVLAALLPLRAVAGVVIGYCAAGHQEQPVAAQVAHGGHDHAAADAHHRNDGQPAKPVTPTCSICAEHCTSAAFAPGSAPQAVAIHAAAEASPSDDARAVPPFFPDQLDRPPLA